MTDIYAMRRANDDWFVLEDHGRLRVPLFQSSHDAMMARLRNVGMLLFEPVALDARLLREIQHAADDVDYCLVKDPFANLSRAAVLPPSTVASLFTNIPNKERSKRSTEARFSL